MARVYHSSEYEILLSEYAACKRQLRSKEEALHILKGQLDSCLKHNQELQDHTTQLRSQLVKYLAILPSQDLSKERESFVLQLEEAQEKIVELERELQAARDEREDTMSERDYLSSKCNSLLKNLEEQHKVKPPSQEALEAAMEENRELTVQLVEALAERDQAVGRLERRKQAAEWRKKQEAQKQSLKIVSSFRRGGGRNSRKHVLELESLASNLSETVNDKSIAVAHQKKANKMLASRIADLEHRLKVLEVSGLWSTSPGQQPKLYSWDDKDSLSPSPKMQSSSSWSQQDPASDDLLTVDSKPEPAVEVA